jgi:hypothetical protein
VPDEKVRQGAALAIFAYKLSRPVERSENLHLHATVDDFNALIDRVNASPVMMLDRAAGLLETDQKAQTHSDGSTKPEAL